MNKMGKDKEKEKEKIFGFRADDDVARLLERAHIHTGASFTYLLQKCVRIGLKEYAGKKDAAA